MSTTDLKKVFAANLARLAAGRSQAEMADLLGVKQPQYQRWASGSMLPRAERIADICKRLGIPEDALLCEISVRDEQFEKRDRSREIVYTQMNPQLHWTAQQLQTMQHFPTLGQYFEHLVRKDITEHKEELRAVVEQNRKDADWLFKTRPLPPVREVTPPEKSRPSSDSDSESGISRQDRKVSEGAESVVSSLSKSKG